MEVGNSCVVRSCDDGNFCNGQETCLPPTDGGVASVCVSGPAPNCSDSLSCTLDSCSQSLQACANTLVPSACTCNAIALPVISASLSLPVVSLEVPCVGNPDYKVGTSLTAEAVFSGSDPTCANGCESTFNGSYSVAAMISLCTRGKPKGGMGSFGQTRRGCLDCNGSTCQQTCQEGGCRTNTGGASLNVGLEHYRKLKKSAGFGLELKCALKGAGSGDVTVAYTGTSRVPTADGGACGSGCQECDRVTTTMSAMLSGSGDCFFGAELPLTTISTLIPKPAYSIVAKGSVTVSDTATGTVTGQGGECINQTCGSMGMEGGVKAKLSGTLKKLWYEAKVECGGGFKGCAEVRTCGACACGMGRCTDVSRDDFSCKVTLTPVRP